MAQTTWKSIAEEIKVRIGNGELEAGARLLSGDEIAADWGVSRHTAHRAVDELRRQGLVVRQRRWGTVVAEKKERPLKRVMFVVDVLAQAVNFPSSDLIRGVQDGIGESVHLILAGCNGDWQQEEKLLKRAPEEVDGLIICPTSDPKNNIALQHLIDSGFPVVILDRVPDGIHGSAVVSDNEEVGLRAIRKLEERGHRKIAFFSFYKPGFSSVTERYSAYTKALEEVGISDVTRYTRWFAGELEEYPQHFVQTVYDSLFTLMNQSDPITALFCVQDSLASAALQACDRMGISVPEQLEVVTFNDWPPVLLRSPWAIHRIVQRHYEIGSTAADLLRQQVANPTRAHELRRVAADLCIADTALVSAVS